MSTLDKHTQVFDPDTGKWITKEQYKWKRDWEYAPLIVRDPSVMPLDDVPHQEPCMEFERLKS